MKVSELIEAVTGKKQGFDFALTRWMKKEEKRQKKVNSDQYGADWKIGVLKGRKFHRVFMGDGYSEMVNSFIELATGDVYDAADARKHKQWVVGNIFET